MKLLLTLMTLCLMLGCSKPKEPWVPPTMAPQGTKLIDELNRDDPFAYSISQRIADDAEYSEIISAEYDLDAGWITYIVGIEYAMVHPHRRLLLTQHAQRLTAEVLAEAGRTGPLQIFVSDINFNWLAGTDPDGNPVVKP